MLNRNLVFPRVYVNNDLVNNTLLVDNTNQAFQKYNLHEHIRAVMPDFRAYPLELGDSVYVYDENNSEVFSGTTPALVDYITGTKLRLTQTCTKDLESTVLYYKAPKGSPGSRLLYGVSVQESSQYVTFSSPVQTEEFQVLEGLGLPGFISQSQLHTLNRNSYNYRISLTSNFNVINASVEADCRINSVSVFTSSGGGSLQLKVFNPTNVLHLPTDHTTWDNYGPVVEWEPNVPLTFNYLDRSRDTFPVSYPVTSPDSYVKAGSMLGLFTTPDNTSLALTLNYHKILY